MNMSQPDWQGGGNSPDESIGTGAETLQKITTTSQQVDNGSTLNPTGGNAPVNPSATPNA